MNYRGLVGVFEREKENSISVDLKNQVMANHRMSVLTL